MPNMQGLSGTTLPGSYSVSDVIGNGLSIPANQRVLCVIGEGSRREVLISNAAGGGADGLNSTFSGNLSGTNGRRFQLSNYPIITNRTELYKNGILLTGKEESITSAALNPIYDYRLDIDLGRIELKGASLVDQGGAYYSAVGSNVGDGYISTLSLIDDSAPSETFTIRCASVRRDIGGVPIDGYARFVCSGSVSGVILDGYGSPIVWIGDGAIRNNGILRFAIYEGATTSFEVGDTFTVEVESGVLESGDSLVANYIATLDINNPELFTDFDSVTTKHGIESTTNTLSLGARLAFNNAAPGVLCLQAAPGMPRRVTHTLVLTGTGGTDPEDLKFNLPVGVVPDTNADIKFFIVNTVTDAETQILPNKVAFFDPTITAAPDTWITTASPYSYTVVMETAVTKEGEDLEIESISGSGPAYYAVVSSASHTFDLADYVATASLHIWGSAAPNNNGNFTITGVSGGKLTITGTAAFTVSTATLHYRLLDTAQDDTAMILFTQDLALTTTQGLKAGVVDVRDATFYDANWISALEVLETQEVDIVVPLPTTTKSAIIQSTLSHCENMSRIKNRKERVMLTGGIQGLLPANVIGTSLAAVEDLGVLEGIQGDSAAEILGGNIEDLANYGVANSFGTTYRCVYFYPDRIVMSISGSNTYVDGMYMAAAAGGWLSAQGNVAVPLTNKTISGFSILIDRTYSILVTENIVGQGICLVQPVLGGGKVVWGITTSQSGYVEEQEISIVFIRDKIAKEVRTACNGLIGQAESATFGLTLEARIYSFLLGKVAEGIITKFADIKVKRNDTDPTQWDVTFKVQPAYPINFIYIRFSIGTF